MPRASFVEQLESLRLRHVVEQYPDPGNRHVVASAAILRGFKILSARVEAELEVWGLTMARYEVLGLLEASPEGRMTLTELSRAALLHPATMTYTISGLEKRRLIRRRTKPSDKRVVLAEITPLGRKVVRGATVALADQQFGLAELSNDEAAEVAIVLSRLHPGVSEVDAPAESAG